MVGANGGVTGIDMTPAMVDLGRGTARRCGVDGNTRFVEGIIDIDTCGEGIEPASLVISNGVFNLCINKTAAFQTAFRLTKPGGVFVLADVCREPEQSTGGADPTR